MATTKKFDVCYLQKGKNEGDKGFWKNIGVVLENEKGMFLKLETLPIGWDGFASFFTPKPKEGKKADGGIPRNNDPDEDIKF
jgi:hypothetical protein